MSTFDFTLRVEGLGTDRDGYEALSEALCREASDCSPYFFEGVAYAAFDREAATLRDAVVSAVESVRRADRSVRVTAVLRDDGQPIDEAFLDASVPSGPTNRSAAARAGK